jgi:hypothetical protein
MIPLLAALAVGAVPFRATLTAPTHTPKANARWNYSVRAVNAQAKAVRARLTVQVVDPFGGVYPVEFGNTTRKVVGFPFTGTFRDYVQWPPEARGFKLTFRVTVMSAGRAVRLTYWVRPR